MNIDNNGPGLSNKEILEIYRDRRLSRVDLAKKYAIKASDVGRIKNGKLFINVTHNNGKTFEKIKNQKAKIIRSHIAETERELTDNEYQLSLYSNRAFMLENQLQILKLQLKKISRS